MNIYPTKFEYKHYSTEQTKSRIHGPYAYHNVDAWNTINFEGIELNALYQTGLSYLHNDYDYPSNELELSDAFDPDLGGTSEVLLILNNLYESDFSDQEKMAEILDEIKKLCPVVDSIKNIFELYQALMDNKPNLADFKRIWTLKKSA